MKTVTKFLCLLACIYSFSAFADSAFMNDVDPSYNKDLITVTPALVKKIKVGLKYDALVRLVGKEPMYCNDGDSKADPRTCFNCACRWDGHQPDSATSYISGLSAYFNNGAITSYNTITSGGHYYASTVSGETFKDDYSKSISDY